MSIGDAGPVDRLQQRLQAIVEQLAGAVSAEVVTLFVYDEQTNDFDLPVGCNLNDRATFADPRMLPGTDRVAGKIIQEQTEFVENPVTGGPLDGPFARRERVVAASGFPLVHGRRPVGIMFVDFRRPHRLTEDETAKAREHCQRAAAAIADAGDALDVLQQRRAAQLPKSGDRKALGELMCSVTPHPVAVWLLEPDNKTIRIVIGSGIPAGYWDNGIAEIGDGSVISEVVGKGRRVTVENVLNDNRFRYPLMARAECWASVMAFPLQVSGRTRGAFEVFSCEPGRFGSPELDVYRLETLAALAAVIVENEARSRQFKLLADLARELSESPNFNKALQLIVRRARELTGADSSTLFLLDSRTDRFIQGFRWPAHEIAQMPRQKGGITRAIIDTGDPVLIDDTATYPNVRDSVRQQGIRSVAGVRIQIREERFGVLYVNSTRVGQFTKQDVELLKAFAGQASAALGWARLLLKPLGEVERATSRLFRLDEILEGLCDRMQRLAKFDFAALQLANWEEDVIETVKAIGVADKWAALAKHHIAREPKLDDIQAAIALSACPRVEVIRGWDDRFDFWIYEDNNHKDVVRAFIPLVVVYDEKGDIVRNWSKLAEWSLPKEAANERRGWCSVTTAALPPADPSGKRLNWRVIGTVELGYRIRSDAEAVDRARRLVKDGVRLASVAARVAARINHALLPEVLRVILGEAVGIFGADGGTLYFQKNALGPGYDHKISTGTISKQFLDECPPREEAGLGYKALQTKQPQFIPDPSQGHPEDHLKTYNPKAWEEGIRAMVAIPLSLGADEGLLYVDFRRLHRFTQEEIGWIQLFANGAQDAIQHATEYTRMRNRARHLHNLQAVVLSLVGTPETSNLLARIAWNTLDILAADLVVIYEYSEPKQDFSPTGPHIAGRLRVPDYKATEPGTAPHRFLKLDQPQYIERDAWQSETLNPARRTPATAQNKPFVVRETVEAVAGMPLVVAGERVGVIFINYRRPHAFSLEERGLIETLASAAAIAIKNHRSLEELITQNSENKAVTELGALATFVLHKTKDWIGEIKGRAQDIHTQSDPEVRSRRADRIEEITDIIGDEIKKIVLGFQSCASRETKAVDLRKILATACSHALGAGLDGFEDRLPEKLAPVAGGEEPLVWVFENLLRNAREHARGSERPSIVVDAEAVTDGNRHFVRVSVADAGVGMSEELVKAINGYVPWQDAEGDTDEGLRIGIPLSRIYVILMGGRMSVESSLGQGAKFTMELPAWESR